MFTKGSKTYSIVQLKCPRCQESDAFETGSWSFKKAFDMREKCPVCGLNYFPEPGYYYGSMFISYIWTGWFSIFFVAILHWWLGLSIDWTLAFLAVFFAFNFVYIFRISRLMWLNLNVKFNPDLAKTVQKP